MSEANYISDQQQRLLRVIQALAGHEIEGLAPGQLAQLTESLPSQITRHLANLKAFGWAEQIPTTNRWRLGPEIVQISLNHQKALSRARTRLDETTNRYSRS